MDALGTGLLRRSFDYLAWAMLGSAFMAVACPAAEYWVAADGNDGAAGSVEKPIRLIQHGVSVMQPGDTLWVRAGRYQENASLGPDKSGAPDKWLTVSAAPGDERKAVVGIETPRVDAYGGSSSAFSLHEVQYVRLRGFYCVAPDRGSDCDGVAGRVKRTENSLPCRRCPLRSLVARRPWRH